jgi:xanthine dehydrogenase accessory factor
MKEILKKALLKFEHNVEFVLATVVETSGSAPTETGCKILVTASEVEGTVGGGALEKEAVGRARALLESGERGRLVEINVADLDMKCGGSASLFFEPFRAQNRLYVFGGGHIAKALAPLAASLRFSVIVVDDRPEFADKERFPHASQIILSSYGEAARKVAPGSFVVIATHGHVHDEEVLDKVARLEPPLPYIGMIGSKNKAYVVLERLKDSGLNPGANIYSPIGLDLGGGSPEEIALSIASEMLGVLNKKDNLPHLRERIDQKDY